MTFGSILYQLFISPITLLLEVVFALFFSVLNSCGAAIFPLSLVVNLLLLPFYNRADSIQDEERRRQEKMAPFVEHIKKTFKGDERYMMLQSFYRENGYKPVYALRSTIALVLEIPFFIAAYNFLSNLPALRGTRFLFLQDLGQPDSLFSINGFSINVLPILMTLINIISSEIYTKGQKFKDKITLHGMALIFLVLLYNSPSGLVLYWTLNNVFSLGKNIVRASTDKKRTVRIILFISGAVLLIYAALFHGPSQSRLVILMLGLLCLCLGGIRSSFSRKSTSPEKKADHRLFFTGALFLSVFLGALIPSYVITASPAEFIILTSVHSPVRYIFYAFLSAFGTFAIWGGLFYYLAKERNKRRATVIIWCFAILSAIDFLLFGKNENILTSDLQFDPVFYLPSKQVIINLIVVVIVIPLIILICKKASSIIRFLGPVLLAVAIALSGYNVYKISSEMPSIRRAAAHTTKQIPQVELSKDGKNVVVIMLDRAISSYLPYIFQENPELKRQFSGFTWYPNTLSFGMLTVIAAPALFGGYDYTPSAINAREDLTLIQKHNEALLTMPVIFSEAGYAVDVFDPPYANYSVIPDLSIYEEYPNIHAYNTEYGLFLDADVSEDRIISSWKRNFFCYSLMKSSPLFMQSLLYSSGSYFAPGDTQTIMQKGLDDTHRFVISAGFMNAFTISYNSLKSLPSMTIPSDSGTNHFFLIQNGTSHNVMPLQEPEYEPAYEVDNTEFDKTHTDRFTLNGRSIVMDDQNQLSHYQCNLAAWREVGRWMDHLKEIGVYDNTRIIIVSDHGWPTGSNPDMLFLDGAAGNAVHNSKDAMAYNPVLFVKDFGATGDYTIDYTFMTNADTPYLAMQGLIEDPVNPFTHKPIYQPEAKNAEKLFVMYADTWSLPKEARTIDPEGMVIWYSLRNRDIFNRENWEQADS